MLRGSKKTQKVVFRPLKMAFHFFPGSFATESFFELVSWTIQKKTNICAAQKIFLAKKDLLNTSFVNEQGQSLTVHHEKVFLLKNEQ